MGNAKIMIVEDEPNIIAIIKAYLEKNGYLVYIAENGRTALHMFESLSPDLILLDLALPDISGEEVCRTIRRTSNVPILMLTAKSSEDDKVNGLLIGADDYLTKPFSPRELIARIISLLRRSQAIVNEKTTLSFLQNELVINLETREVYKKNKLVTLTPIEFSILVTLAQRPKRVYSRVELINQIQGYTFDGYERTVDVHIKNLRQKIKDDSKRPVYISTVFGIGYKFLVNADE